MPNGRVGRVLAVGAMLLALGGGGCGQALPRAKVTGGPAAPAVQPVPAATPNFADVPPGYWAFTAITSLARAGLVQGVAPGRFAPARTVSRAQFAVWLDRLGGIPLGAPGPSFADVPSGGWFAPAVQAVAGQGWMRGVGPGRFGPNRALERLDALQALERLLGAGRIAQDAGQQPCPFVDCPSLASERGVAVVASELGLAQGGPAGHLRPDAPLTRAQAAELLDRARSVSAAQVALAGSRVATLVRVDPSVADVPSGGSLQISAWAHDARGYIVPAAFTFTVGGPGRLVQVRGATADVQAEDTGTLEVSATLTGGATLGATATVYALAPGRLVLGGAPPEQLAGVPLTLEAEVLSTSGTLDAAAAGSLACTLSSASAWSGTFPMRAGRASLTLPGLKAGEHVLRCLGQGLPSAAATLRVVATPLGALAVRVATGTLAPGASVAVEAAFPGQASWPLAVTAVQHPVHLPPLVGESPPPSVARVTPLAAVTGQATVATLTALSPGTVEVTVGVVGGALRAASTTVRVTAAGAFGAPQPSEPVAAGQTAVLAIPLRGSPAGVWVEPIDPAGHPLPSLEASVTDGIAQASFVPHAAGVWQTRWLAPGMVPVAGSPLTVLPGPAARLQVVPRPSSQLQPGTRTTLDASLVDAYGNALTDPFRLRLLGSRPTGLGALATRGPGPVATFTATQLGSRRLVFSSPDHPSLGTAAVTLRTVPSAAAIVSGPGLWLTFPDWRDTPDATILAEARRVGATHLYLEVATSADGFYGGRALDDLLGQAHAAGLAVVAWVYAALSAPEQDMALARQVAAYVTPAGDRADGLALDVEQELDPATVALYAASVRHDVGAGGLLVGITWAPQQKPSYPYAQLAASVNVLAPMDYWHTREQDDTYAATYTWVRDSVAEVRALSGRPLAPVEVIAQTFDWFSQDGQGIFSPSADELAAARRAASDSGALGISYYRPATATPAEWAVMSGAAAG